MNADQQPISKSILIEGELTERIIGAAFKVLNPMGTGFLEEVYENALSFELHRNGLLVEAQKVFPVKYGDVIVGEYRADLVVAGKVVVECKSVSNQ